MPVFNVLHVEDEASDRMIVAAAFSRVAPHVRIRTAVDGDDAIAYLSGQGAYGDREKHPLPRLILLDLKLPKKSGLDVLRWIRNQAAFQALPVFMLTSSQEQPDLDRARALGATSYLVKSVDFNEMRITLRGIGEAASPLDR